MRIFGRVELTTADYQSELRFTAVRRDGLFEFAAGPIFVILALYFGWKWQRPWYLAFGGIALLSLVANWIQGGATELRVTGSELLATGNLAKMFSTEIRVPADEIKTIRYEAGGEGDPGGLYIRRGWGRTCLLPGLNSEQADEVAQAIYLRFPDIGSGDHNPNSLLFGDQSNLTVLGLSDSKRKYSDTET